MINYKEYLLVYNLPGHFLFPSYVMAQKPDVPNNFKKYKSKTIPKNIILLKSKYDLKTRY